VTGQGNGRPGPGPGLGGTGRVADELYLIAHHELTGRPYLATRAVGLGLAGALLAELVLAGAITIEAGTVSSVWPGQAGDQLTAAVAAQIAGEDSLAVADWLAFLGRTAAGDVAARLAGAGYLAAAPRRSWRVARWVPADPDCAFAPVARLDAALGLSRPGDGQVVALGGLAVACGLGPRLFLYLPPGARARIGALIPLLGPGLGEVIAQTHAAVDAALLAHRI
jgi:Golgi phosphoprotein 3 (GPP34)